MAETASDVDDQVAMLDDHVEDAVEYYIICDGCRGCFDQETHGVGQQLYDQGWRVTTNERGHETALCPECTAVPEAEKDTNG